MTHRSAFEDGQLSENDQIRTILWQAQFTGITSRNLRPLVCVLLFTFRIYAETVGHVKSPLGHIPVYHGPCYMTHVPILAISWEFDIDRK